MVLTKTLERMNKALDYLEEKVLSRELIHTGEKLPLNPGQVKSLGLPKGNFFLTEEILETRSTWRDLDVRYALKMAYMEGQSDMLKDVSAVCDLSNFSYEEEILP